MESEQSRTEQGKNEIEDLHKDRMSLSECKQLMKSKKNVLTDEQILMFRDFLYVLAEIDYRITMQVFQIEDLEKEQIVQENLPMETTESKQADQEPPQEEKEQQAAQSQPIQLTPIQYKKAS